jgi:hypothetical protein
LVFVRAPSLESNDGATISQHNIAMAGQANEARLLFSTTDWPAQGRLSAGW